MKSNRNIAILVGILFIVQMITAVISIQFILDPILKDGNFLSELASNTKMTTFGMLLELICGISVFAIAVLLFPILKQFNERVAIWYVGQRVTELVCFMVSGIVILTLLKISQDILNKSIVESTHLKTIANTLLNVRVNIQIISLLIYCFGAWSFYGLLYYSKIIPRFISVWGLLGVTLLFIEVLSNTFDISVGGILIMIPLGLNELFLGFWLILKGFNINIAK